MKKTFQWINRILLGLGLLLVLVVVIGGLISAALNWQGTCEDASGVQMTCSWGRFALQEMFWGAFLLIPYFFLATLVYLVMTLVQFIASLRKRRSLG